MQKRYDKAIADFNEAVRLNPRDPFAYTSRGMAWQNQKDYDKAIADFNEAIRLEPRDASNLAPAPTPSATKGSMIRPSPTTIRRSDSTPRMPFPTGTEAMAGRRGRRSEGLCGRRSGDPARPQGSLRLSEPRHGLAAEKGIRESNRRPESGDPARPQGRIRLHRPGNLSQHTKEHEKALADFNEAIRLDPKNAYAYTVGEVPGRTRRKDDRPSPDSNEAIRLDPQDPFAYMSRAHS